MSNLQTENLEERMERIRKRNEELEKKYREAEEDRLMALKENAMVEIKPPKDEDWPREHKYDKLDFTYDQIELPADESPKSDTAQLDENGLKSQDPLRKSKREFKKFSEGDGPPPDPAYNFLADAERDGKSNENPDRKSFELKSGEKKDWKFSNSSNRGSGRGGGGRGRGNKSSPRGGGGRNAESNNYSNEGESWKFGGDKSDRGQKGNDGRQEGNWRREDGRGIDRQNSDKHKNNKSPTNIRPLNRNDSRDGSDARGNIMVSVSQNENGEVKSVKLTSAPIIGTGRVGPRQMVKPQFQIQKEQQQQQNLQSDHINPNSYHHNVANNQSRKNFNRKDNNNFNSNTNNYNNSKARPPRNNFNSINNQNGAGHFVADQHNGETAIINRGNSVNDRLKRIVSTNGTGKAGVQDQVTISVNN